MNILDFEERIKSYSKKNAYWLGMASQIAYKQPEEAESETASWGLSEFEYFDNNNTQAFLAGNEKMLVLAFRGTESIQDWLSNIDINLVDSLQGKVHKGFLTALNYVWQDIWEFIKTKRQQRPLWVAGHSLGCCPCDIGCSKIEGRRRASKRIVYVWFSTGRKS